MNKKTLQDVELKGKKVIMRVDFNVPVKEGVIKDDTHLEESLNGLIQTGPVAHNHNSTHRLRK